MRLYRIVMPTFVCGVVADEGVVTQAAPIMKWAKGQKMMRVASWVHSHGGELQVLGNLTTRKVQGY